MKVSRFHIQKPMISYGETHGNITTSINDSTIINDGSRNRPLLITICVLLFLSLVLAVAFFASFLWVNQKRNEGEIRIGPRGGVYRVDSSGRKRYLDRKTGRELYFEQQKSKK